MSSDDLVADDDTKKERGTLEKSGKGVDFVAYFSAIGKPMKGEPRPSHLKFEMETLKCDGDASVKIPEKAVIVAAYWGDPKNFAHGIDVTAKVIQFRREKNYTTIYGNTEWFGDPWYGSKKGLIIRIATKKALAATPAATPAAPATYPAAPAAYPAAPAAYPAAPAAYPAAPAAYPAAPAAYPAAPAAYPAAPAAYPAAPGQAAYPAPAAYPTIPPAVFPGYPPAAPAAAADARIEKVLKELNLEMWIATFHEESVDYDSLLHLTNDDLKELGLRLGERKRVARWQKKQKEPKVDPAIAEAARRAAARRAKEEADAAAAAEAQRRAKADADAAALAAKVKADADAAAAAAASAARPPPANPNPNVLKIPKCPKQGHLMVWTRPYYNRYGCDKCGVFKVGNRWHCGLCKADYCPACDAPPPGAACQAAAPRCPTAGHPMAVSAGTYRRYICNGCRRTKTGVRWFCGRCKDDYCFSCQPRGNHLTGRQAQGRMGMHPAPGFHRKKVTRVSVTQRSGRG